MQVKKNIIMGFPLYFWYFILASLLAIMSVRSIYRYYVMCDEVKRLKQAHHNHVLKHASDLRTICHNLNTPLNGVFSVVELFKTEMFGELPRQYQDYTNMAIDSVDDLRKNIEDVLQYCDNYLMDNQKIIKSDDVKSSQSQYLAYVLEQP